MLKSLLAPVLSEGRRAQLRALSFRFRALAYTGSAVECPLCGGSFSRFAPFHGRPDAQCPRCGALERHRLQWLFLQRRTDLLRPVRKRRLRVLQLAPEPVTRARFRQFAHLEYLAADFDSPLADVRMDLTDIQYPNRHFDVILCSHVLEHIADDRRAMREMRRVVADSGWAMIQVPVEWDRAATYEDWSITTPEGRLRAFRQRDHVRLYGRDFLDRLREAGWEVTQDDFGATLPEHEVRRSGLVPEPINVCRPAH